MPECTFVGHFSVTERIGFFLVVVHKYENGRIWHEATRTFFTEGELDRYTDRLESYGYSWEGA